MMWHFLPGSIKATEKADRLLIRDWQKFNQSTEGVTT